MQARQGVLLMGEKPRPKPTRLAEKLKEIRMRIDGGLTQVEMITRLGYAEDELPQDRISKFERGAMEPSLAVLIAYSDAVNCYLEVLARDDLSLGPGPLPYPEKHHGLPVESAKKTAVKSSRPPRK